MEDLGELRFRIAANLGKVKAVVLSFCLPQHSGHTVTLGSVLFFLVSFLIVSMSAGQEKLVGTAFAAIFVLYLVCRKESLVRYVCVLVFAMAEILFRSVSTVQ